MSKKQNITGIIVVVIFYLFILPLLWPRPTVKINLTEETPYDEDFEVTLVISSWHPNYEIQNVRFFVDYKATTAHGPEGPFYPVSLHTSPRRENWSFRRLNRFSWPRSHVHHFTVSLSTLAMDNVVKPGIVKGKIDVTLNYADPMPYDLAIWLGYQSRSTTQAIPFELQLK